MAIPPTQSDTAHSGHASEVLDSSASERPAIGDLNAPAEFAPDWVYVAKAEPVCNAPNSQQPAPATPRKPRTIPATVAGMPIIQTEPPEPTPPPPPPILPPDASVELAANDDDEEEDEAAALELEAIAAAAPPWLVSLVVHVVMLILLAVLFLPALVSDEINLNLAFSETFGEQLEEEVFTVAEEPMDEELITTDIELNSVEDPLASPNEDLVEAPEQLHAAAPFETPNIGLALSGREAGMREALLEAYGGDQTTEYAVYIALQWLKKQQRKDGSWRLNGPYSDGARVRNPLAATSMALLAFQGAGHTHKTTRKMVGGNGNLVETDFRKQVRLAWKQMLKWQDKDGCFYRKSGVDHIHQRLYSQAQATIAICELYGMTRDPDYRRPAQRAINFCCEVQDQDGDYPDGGWRYEDGRESDMSATGWFVMALQSAKMAGLDVPSDVYLGVEEFLDSVTEKGSFYSYMPGRYATPSMTAEGLLCRQYLGWQQDDPRILKGVEYLRNRPVDWEEPNTYYWYYATQVMHHMEGDHWFEWNAVMKKQLTKMQVSKGKEKGSWAPDGDQWGRAGGRLYQTCLCTFMLEVYYRHLPIYASL